MANDRHAVSRRELLRAIGLGIGSLAVGSLAAACGSPTPPPAAPTQAPAQAPAPPPAAPAAPAATTAPAAVQQAPAAASQAAKPASAPAGGPAAPKRGGTWQVGIAQSIAGLDPHINLSLSDVMAVAPCYNGIVRLDPETGTKVVGDLAESWTVSPDGATYTFKLKGGNIRWHDGKALTMDDVIFSLNKMGTPVQGKSLALGGTFENVAKVEPVDGQSFKIVLKKPSADFIWELSADFAKIVPKHIVAADGDMNKQIVGTGPFKIKEYRSGSYLDLVRNADYAVEPGRPYLDGIRISVVPDIATRLQAMTTGRLDTLGRAGPEQLNAAQAKQVVAGGAPVKAWEVPDRLGVHFMMNTRKPPFNDLRVRKAAFLALDRQLAIKVIGNDTGLLPGFFPEGWGMSQDELAKLPGFRQPKDQDIAEAKGLMSQAGYGDGLPFTLLSRTQPSTLQPAQFIAQQLQAVGFKPSIKPVEDAQFWDTGAKADFDGMVFTPATAMPINQYGKVIAPRGRLNFTGLDEDPKNAAMWSQQLVENDEAKRKALLKDIEKYWYTELYGTAPLIWQVVHYVSSTRTQNFVSPELSSAGMMADTIWLNDA